MPSHAFHDVLPLFSRHAKGPELADRVGGYRGGYDRKIAVAEWIRAAGISPTVNAVWDEQNIDQMSDMLDLAVKLGARRVEIATV